MTTSSHIFQPPTGTRDFFPEDMAVRRYIESIWREASIRHGFDEIEGPTFEHLELYTMKSGAEIVSELFSFRRAGGDTDYALRPEFTPTLARMVAANANALPKPIKWYSIPTHYRAERPQRGRLREFVQWNVDMVGDPSPAADAEIIAVAVESLRLFGMPSEDITIKISHRELIAQALNAAGVAESDIEPAMQLLDRRDKLSNAEFQQKCDELQFRYNTFATALQSTRDEINRLILSYEKGEAPGENAAGETPTAQLHQLIAELHARGVLRWCEFDPNVVRGLAYYTGIVFEIHRTDRDERAIAGGGRYDKLIELFGGPSTPACGFAMGDVVIKLILEDKNLLQPAAHYLPRPDVFVISNGAHSAETKVVPLVAQLRQSGYHVRHTYRATRNVGKLLGEAGKANARCAVILDDALAENRVSIKDLVTGEQQDGVALDDLERIVAQLVAAQPSKHDQ